MAFDGKTLNAAGGGGDNPGLLAKSEIPGVKTPLPPEIRSYTNIFCSGIETPNIEMDNKITERIRIINESTKGNNTYGRCQGTTTVFNAKDCINRQCRCLVNMNNEKEYQVRDFTGEDIFLEAEKTYIAQNATARFTICNRHHEQIPFEWLTSTRKQRQDALETATGIILELEVQLTDTGKLTKTVSDNIKFVQAMVNQLQDIGDQRVANVLYTIKRTLSQREPREGNVEDIEQLFSELNDNLLRHVTETNTDDLQGVTIEDTSQRVQVV